MCLLNLEAGIDGELRWLMVEDFNEFSAIVTNPIERLHLRQFVRTYSTHTDQIPSMKGIEDEVVG
jgi:4-hydroxy-L-threonine phosphate dehydrogenase PdxA